MTPSTTSPDGIATSVKQLLNEVGRYVHPPQERTLFSLGGRSYYENPASDMLAFFLTPEAEHGFRSLFLSVFLDCMKVEPARLNFNDVMVHREVETEDGSRIDVLVDAPDWVLVIENKVYHAQVNPFTSYETYARNCRGGKQAHFAILSPSGQSATPGWSGVSYKEYCRALRERLAEILCSVPYSKWLVFAREFILHLANELYIPAMTPEQALFIENHVGEVAAVKKLDSQYRAFLHEELKSRLQEKIPGNDFETRDHGWAIRCYSRNWGQSNIAFWRESSGTSRRFQLTVYLIGLSEEQRSKGNVELRQLRRWPEGAWLAWQTQPGFDKREDALKELCRLSGIVDSLLRVPPVSLPPPPNGFERQGVG